MPANQLQGARVHETGEHCSRGEKHVRCDDEGKYAYDTLTTREAGELRKHSHHERHAKSKRSKSNLKK